MNLVAVVVATGCTGPTDKGSGPDIGAVGDTGERDLAEASPLEDPLGPDVGGQDTGNGDGGDGDDTGLAMVDCDWWVPDGSVAPPTTLLVGQLDVQSIRPGIELAANGNSEGQHALRVDWNGDGWRDLAFTGGSWVVDDGYRSTLRVFSTDWRSIISLDMLSAWCGQIAMDGSSPDINRAAVLDINLDGYEDLLIRDDDFDADPQGRLSLFTGPFADGTTAFEPEEELPNAIGAFTSSTPVIGRWGPKSSQIVMTSWISPDGPHRVTLLDSATMFEQPLDEPTAWLEGGDGDTRGFAGVLLSDLTGDGVDDVHVLTLNPDAGGGWAIYDGPVEEVRDWTDYAAYIVQDDATESLGVARSGGMDLNHDGYEDLVLGAWQGGPGHEAWGRVFVLHGPLSTAAPVSSLAAARLTSDIIDGRFGYRLTADADLDGDGWKDLVIGAPRQPITDSEFGETKGAVYVYYGPVSGELGSNDADATLLHPAITAKYDSGFGEEVASLGDLDGDGIDDVWIRPTHYTAPSTLLFGAPR